MGRDEGNTYQLGPAARQERGRWVPISNQFVSIDGLARASEPTGTLLYDALDRDGRWLTYSLATRGTGESVSAPEVLAAARGMLRSEGRVSSHLERFVIFYLATREVPASRGALRCMGCTLWQKWRRSKAGGQVPQVAAAENERSIEAHESCCEDSLCGMVLLRMGGTLGHDRAVPPLLWTGTGPAGLLLPACGICNRPDGPKIDSVPSLSFDRPDLQVLQSLHEWQVLIAVD